MAEVVNSLQQRLTGLSFTVALPDHQAGDVFVAFMGTDFSSAFYGVGSSGWTSEGGAGATNARGYCFSFRATT